MRVGKSLGVVVRIVSHSLFDVTLYLAGGHRERQRAIDRMTLILKLAELTNLSSYVNKYYITFQKLLTVDLTSTGASRKNIKKKLEKYKIFHFLKCTCAASNI